MRASETAKSPDATVFVVDDDPAVRKSLRWLMESLHLRVETFESGQAFLEQYDSQRPGCLVLDVRMPGLSGLDLQERLRERGPHVPIIVMTAYGDVPMAVRAMKHGAIHFFEKPVSEQVLLDQIQAAIAEDLSRRELVAQENVIAERYGRLTKREAEVLDKVVGGFSSREIGTQLGVSFKTVEAHRAKIMRKMEAESVPHLIRLYLCLSQHRLDASPSSATVVTAQ